MADEKKRRGTDESVDFYKSRLPIHAEAEQNPAQEIDSRNSRRLSADLPYGLPTDDTHPTGTPAEDISSGFSDLKRGQTPRLEDENMEFKQGGSMNDQKSNQKQDNDAAEQRRKEPTYDAEKEMPDPEQVEKDIAEAERQYGGKKSA